ncbi:thiamine phosphate synthase [Dyadobacter sandarakinus]|uniref:Thiamine-phosphate synthase n=1 Tax=Dyadobacter sandarakinus TaxID=2747268 RepID=A0ABX7I4K7_9BACT|nr:thiamine phosphate synthase [Dyadobacter sandarakinus]QRR00779.1 thiamine phosphate synthase [Dyadobacter sandarakinus]
MDLIVITHPEMLPDEADIINRLFALGLPRLHVRKPEVSEADMKALIQSIAKTYRGRMVLHQHHQLAAVFDIGGIHFTEHNRLMQTADDLNEWKKHGFTLSTSIHDPDALQSLSHSFDYVFLGPVFDSISKPGYKSRIPDEFYLNKYNYTGKVFALGGIDVHNIQTIAQMGMDGAAVLGSIWQKPENAVNQFRLLASLPDFSAMKSEVKIENDTSKNADKRSAGHSDQQFHTPVIGRLQFISQETEEMSHLDSIRLALEAGCRWIQLRIKGRTEEEILAMAREAIQLCDRFGARLIINDHPRVARTVQAYGLHLGLTDMPIPEARSLVSRKMIIGGTANTWEDIQSRIAEGADYIGLGPFRFTRTKQNLSPILGTDGYARLMQQMTENRFQTPIIAIGGVTPEDIDVLRQTGIYGVALSSALIGAADPKATVSQIQQALC